MLDFGIAKALTEIGAVSQAVYASTLIPQEHALTEQGALLGTLPYMSPEQWGADDIDERTDLWAVGIMLYEMLAGQHPLAPLSYGKLQKQVPDLDLPMPSIGTAAPGLDTLADIIDGCLRKPKAERTRSAETLLHALAEIRAGASIGARNAARDDATAALSTLTEERDTDPGRKSVPAYPEGLPAQFVPREPPPAHLDIAHTPPTIEAHAALEGTDSTDARPLSFRLLCTPNIAQLRDPDLTRNDLISISLFPDHNGGHEFHMDIGCVFRRYGVPRREVDTSRNWKSPRDRVRRHLQ